jgi:3-oxoadipate enol-lactonase
MPYATANGLQIYYETEGSGEPLVLVGGYSSDSSHWFLVREELGRHFQVVMPDNRGTGRTDPPTGPFSIEDMGDDVVKLCDALNLKSPHLLGNSMGGAIVQSIAYRYPKWPGKIILSQTFIKVRQIVRGMMRGCLHLLEHQVPIRDQLEITFPWLFSEEFYRDPKKLEYAIERKMQYPYKTPPEVMRKQFGALCEFDSSSWHHKISAETLVLAGSQDLICPLEDCMALAKGIQGAKIHVFPNMGHMASLEIPSEYNRVIREFLT